MQRHAMLARPNLLTIPLGLLHLIEVLHWLLYTDMETWRPVHLRTDSNIAIGWATGGMSAKTNQQLAHTAHKLYWKVKVQREGKVTWAHVYLHTGYVQNEAVEFQQSWVQSVLSGKRVWRANAGGLQR